MADSLHRAKLAGGAVAWNAWRRADPSLVPDLDDLDLSLTERQLSPLHGTPIDLRRARLSRATLRHAALIGADLREAVLAEADLMNARLEKANLAGADLTDAVLDDADLDGANFEGAIVSGARLHRARNVSQAQIDRCRGNKTTTLPAHLTCPAGWMAPEDSVPPMPSLDPPILPTAAPSTSAEADCWESEEFPEPAIPAAPAEPPPLPAPPPSVAAPSASGIPARYTASAESASWVDSSWPTDTAQASTPVRARRLVSPWGVLAAASLGVIAAVSWNWSSSPTAPTLPSAPHEYHEARAPGELMSGSPPTRSEGEAAGRDPIPPSPPFDNPRALKTATTQPADALPPDQTVPVEALAADVAPLLRPPRAVEAIRAPKTPPSGAVDALVPPTLVMEPRLAPPPDTVPAIGTPEHLGRSVEPRWVATVTHGDIATAPEPRQILLFEAAPAPDPGSEPSTATVSIEATQRQSTATPEPAPSESAVPSKPKTAIRRPRPAPKENQANAEESSAFAKGGGSLLQQANDQFAPQDGSVGAGGDDSAVKTTKVKRKRARRPAAQRAKTGAGSSATAAQ